eukprot:6801210-Pyramimonas_sp.AAC.1
MPLLGVVWNVYGEGRGEVRGEVRAACARGCDCRVLFSPELSAVVFSLPSSLHWDSSTTHVHRYSRQGKVAHCVHQNIKGAPCASIIYSGRCA